MDEKVKKEQIDYEVEESRPMEDEGNAGCGNGGGTTSDKRNLSTYYAIAAVLAVILFVIAILIIQT